MIQETMAIDPAAFRASIERAMARGAILPPGKAKRGRKLGQKDKTKRKARCRERGKDKFPRHRAKTL